MGADGAPDGVGLVGAAAGYAKASRHLAVVVPSRLGGRNVFAVFVQHGHLAWPAVRNSPDDGDIGNPVDDPVHGVRRRGEEKNVILAAGEGLLPAWVLGK